MNKHLQYLRYVLRHKRFVFIEGFKIGPEYWYQWPVWILRLALHDWDKFTPIEWFAYKRRFDNGNDFTLMRDDPGYQMAYHMHMRRNKHHWQWWITMRDNGELRILQMDDLSRREFLADMRGQGRTVGKPDMRAWYFAGGRDNMKVHPATRLYIDVMIGDITDIIEAPT